MVRAWPALLLWLGLLPVAALADAVGDGLVAWRDGDYATARAHWQPAAEAGDARAMFLLSELYLHGQGVDADQTQALRWLNAAAEGGYAPACYNLGERYLNGRDLPADPGRAAHWWRRAAVQGLVQAQYNLATLYYRGQGVPQDKGQAAWWYQQAAAQGSQRARQALAVLQAEGVSVAGPAEPPPASAEPPPATPQPQPDRAVAGPAVDPLQKALGPDWLRRQPGSGFTLQVFASDDAAAVARFLDDYRFSRQVAVYPFRKAGVAWYGVTYGRFASHAQASAALAELPAVVQRGRPWVRQFADVTALMTDQAD